MLRISKTMGRCSGSLAYTAPPADFDGHYRFEGADVEPVLLTWEEEEEQRRKQVHTGVINERHKEKETAKSMLCDLLAANNLAKSGSVGGGAAFGNSNHASAGEGAAPSLSLSLSSSLAPSKNSNISSIELNNLLQHVATRNAKSLPSN